MSVHVYVCGVYIFIKLVLKRECNIIFQPAVSDII